MVAINTYDRADVRMRIQVAVPQTGVFTLGRSVLNGSDVLGDGYQWDVYEDELVQVSQTSRIDVTSGISTRPIHNIASIIAQSTDLDPNLNPDIHPNSKIIVEYRTSDMSAGVWYGLLTGFITEVSSSYSHTGRTDRKSTRLNSSH